MSTASNKYIAMNPTDSIMMIMQNGVYAWKFATNYGLLLNNSSGANNKWYRGNPLVLVLKMTGKSDATDQTCEKVFNPYGKTCTIKRTGTGCYTINHNVGTANHSIIAQGHGLNSGCIYASIISVGANTDTIKTSDDDTVNDAGTLWISFFDYQTY